MLGHQSSGEDERDMPYVARDKTGAIAAVYSRPARGAKERLSVGDRDLLAFYAEHGDLESIRSGLAESDAALMRVLEDLVVALLQKKILASTDLPSVALEKLTVRQRLRQQLGALALIDPERSKKSI